MHASIRILQRNEIKKYVYLCTWACVYVLSVRLSACHCWQPMGCVYSSRQRKCKTDTVKDSEDIDVGLVLPRRTRVSHATNTSVFFILLTLLWQSSLFLWVNILTSIVAVDDIIIVIIIIIVYRFSWLCCCNYTRESEEAGEVVITKDEQEHKPLLSSSSSKSSESARHARKSTTAQSASLLKDSLVMMHKQPRDAVRQHLLKVWCTAIFIVLFLLLFYDVNSRKRWYDLEPVVIRFWCHSIAMWVCLYDVAVLQLWCPVGIGYSESWPKFILSHHIYSTNHMRLW